LDRITNWRELARQARWSLGRLAGACRVSVRSLERYFTSRMGKTPRAWLMEERMARADELLTKGFSVKETAVALGYKSVEHFARVFKRHYGHCPSRHAAPGDAGADGRGGLGASE